MADELDKLRTDLIAAITASEIRMLEHIDKSVDERAERTETRLLVAFKQWAARFEARVAIHARELAGLDIRFAMVEERLADLERKLEKKQ